MFQLCKEASSYCSVSVRSQYLTDRMLYRVHLVMSRFELSTSVVIGTDYTGSCKSNYHTITTTTAPRMQRNSYYTLSHQLWNVDQWIMNYNFKNGYCGNYCINTNHNRVDVAVMHYMISLYWSDAYWCEVFHRFVEYTFIWMSVD